LLEKKIKEQEDEVNYLREYLDNGNGNGSLSNPEPMSTIEQHPPSQEQQSKAFLKKIEPVFFIFHSFILFFVSILNTKISKIIKSCGRKIWIWLSK